MNIRLQTMYYQMLSVVHVFLGMARGLLCKKKIWRQYPATCEDNTSDWSRRVINISRAQFLFFLILLCAFPVRAFGMNLHIVRSRVVITLLTSSSSRKICKIKKAVIFTDLSILVSSLAG